MKKSAGLLIYKFDTKNKLRVFLVHPGGPFWKNKDAGAWSIPKGEIESGEKDLLSVAKRELKEETGIAAPPTLESYIDLGEITQKSGKVVRAWAYEGDWSELLMCSSYAKVEWPLRSGKIITVPEVDKAGFFTIDDAKIKMNERQFELIERLDKILTEKIVE